MADLKNVFAGSEIMYSEVKHKQKSISGKIVTNFL
jgi:hypothetical protein